VALWLSVAATVRPMREWLPAAAPAAIPGGLFYEDRVAADFVALLGVSLSRYRLQYPYCLLLVSRPVRLCTVLCCFACAAFDITAASQVKLV